MFLKHVALPSHFPPAPLPWGGRPLKQMFFYMSNQLFSLFAKQMFPFMTHNSCFSRHRCFLCTYKQLFPAKAAGMPHNILFPLYVQTDVSHETDVSIVYPNSCFSNSCFSNSCFSNSCFLPKQLV